MEEASKKSASKLNKAKEHVDQLQRLAEKDPEFYEYLKEHNKELLEFNTDDDDIDQDETDEDNESDEEDLEDDVGKVERDDFDEIVGRDFGDEGGKPKKVKSSKGVTIEMVDSWCNSIQKNTSLMALRSLLKAYRAACHYGDDIGDTADRLSGMSSGVFNKVMQFVLSKMDGILRGIFKLPPSGGDKNTIINMKNTKQWKNYNSLVKSYLGNSLHILNQMTDTKMICYTLGRLRYSSIFLVAFPALRRKYVKVILHFWGTKGGALPIVSFLFLRDLCLQLGSDCIDDCFKGMYKAYIFNCESVNAPKLQHIQFLGNCLVELVKLDFAAAYQHGFMFIRQLAMILREAVSSNKKESFRKVYGWKFVNCLELWTGVVCAYSSETDLRALAYPLTQIISGAARLVPTAQYFPLRLRCIRMLNRIAHATGTFIPVSLQLLDMLEMKELNRPPAGGVGNAIDFRTVLKVKKSALKTKAFQETCVFSVIEELNEHLVQWSYSVAFFELSFLPVVRLKNFSKSTKVERFRTEMRQLIRQIEANCEFTNKKRTTISHQPNDLEATALLEGEMKSRPSPLTQYAATLRQRAQERSHTMKESSVLVGEHASVFGSKLSNENGDDGDDNDDVKDSEVFNSTWLPVGETRALPAEEKKKKKKGSEETIAWEDDIVEDLVLSSDEEEEEEEEEEAEGSPGESEDDESEKKPAIPKQQSKKRKALESKQGAKKLQNKTRKPATPKPAGKKPRHKKAKQK